MKHFTELVQGNGAVERGCMDRESSLDREEGDARGEEERRRGEGKERGTRERLTQKNLWHIWCYMPSLTTRRGIS